MSDFPSADEYAAAVQDPKRAFAAAELQTAEFPCPPGQPYLLPAAGTSAVVFRARLAGHDEAFRFFTARSEPGAKSRYKALSTAVAGSSIAAHVPTVLWIDNGVRIRQRTWPMLRMDWVDGDPLDDHVDGLVARRDTAGIAALADQWRSLVGRMQAQRFAHGDLQHGNIIVDRSGVLHLVDFDAVWTPSIEHLSPPAEVGHPNYQPHGGTRWDRWMDTFSALVIHLSLTVISHDPDSWDRFSTGDNLLFSKDDFVSPFSTDVWHYLKSVQRPAIDREVGALIDACGAGWQPTCGLESLLDGIPVPRPAPGDGAPWWVKTAGGAVPGPRSADGPAPDHEPVAPGQPGQVDWRELVGPGPAQPRPHRTVPPPPPSSAGQWWTPPERPTVAGPPPGIPGSEPKTPGQQPVTPQPSSGMSAGRALAIALVIMVLVVILTVVLNANHA